MDYNQIGNFLEKFKKSLFEKEDSHKVIAEVVSKHLGQEITLPMVETKNGSIHIKISPMAKSEILMHKKKILEEIASRLPGDLFKDIR